MLFVVIAVRVQEAKDARATLQRFHRLDNHRNSAARLGNALWIVDRSVGSVLFQVYVERQQFSMLHRWDIAIMG